MATRGCPSGFATDPIMANYRESGFKAVLVKPFKTAELSRAIEAVLGQQVEAGPPAPSP